MFRIEAMGVLKEYVTKNFALDNESLKRMRIFGADYFDNYLAVFVKHTSNNVVIIRRKQIFIVNVVLTK